ncbi:MAG TPA: DEAD/DEAH box helicase [Verrucomicrobiales bacterium]|nr:DEAD/DEAH box helicase [Verrucomicrobiales bacterium]
MQKRLFSELGLSEPTLKAVEKLGFEQTSPIQSATIPALMAGKDIVGQSATGSGKTAAFGIPAIERVSDTERKVQIIVLTPTRELATQVAEEFARLSLFRPKVHAVPIYGGASYDRQFSELRKGPQIVIGTPGRVIDHIHRNTLDLSDVKMAVLDECDRMLDMGFREDIEKILSVTPKGRQMVFFSATLPPPIKRLIDEFSDSPEHIKIEGTAMTVPTVEQVYFDVPPRAKLDALTRLIDVHDARLSIVFANTQRTVDDLADALIARGYAADKLHGGMTQVMRTRTMAKFKNSGFDVLVATDVAGRGIDVEDLDLVINFDLPYDPEDYVHRIGRTGRAGRKGVALTLISGREIYRLQNVERFTRLRIRRGYVPTWDQVEEKRMSGVLDKIRATIEGGKHTAQATYIDRLLDEGLSATDLAAAMLHELLVAEGIETQKPSADPFARADAAPLRGAAAKTPQKAAPAPSSPVAAKAAKPIKEKATPEPSKPVEPVAEETKKPEDAPEKPAKAEKVSKAAKPAPEPVVAPAEPEPGLVEEEDVEIAPVTGESKEAQETEVETGPESLDEDDDQLREENDDEEESVEADASEEEEIESVKPPSKHAEKHAARHAAKAAPKEESGPRPSTTRAQAGTRELDAPASGYKWITLNLGRNDGLTPRDVVDAITEGGEFPGKAVGLIKLHDSETDIQVLAAHAADIVDTLDGGNFEGKSVRAHFPRTKASPFGAKPADKKGKFGEKRKFSDKPRSFDDRPRAYGDKPRPYGDKTRPYGDKPRSYGPARDDRAPRPYSSDDRPRSSYAPRRDDTRSGPPRGGPRKGPGGPKKGPGRW